MATHATITGETARDAAARRAPRHASAGCELAGVSTAVLEGGDGPPVVLLHGPAGNAAHWMRVIPDLARDAPRDRPRPARPRRLDRRRRRLDADACSPGSAS